MTSRRQFLAAAALGTGLASAPLLAADAPRKRVLRIAHLTDVHVQPELKAPEGMAACLRHVQSRADKPDLILFGGDCVMDSFSQTRDRTKTQWDVWQRVLKAECSLPFESCIGNHDVWGWNREESKAKEADMGYGKAMAVDMLELGKRYRSFAKAGWKMIVLDSTHVGSKPGTYTAKLDEEQFDWLAAELKATPATTPILILSHIPIFAACPFLDGDNARSGDWKVPGSWMHVDARKLTAMFHERGNVKVCLSGHIHLQDEVKYLGTRYYCNGAVSGGWWKGSYQQFEPGYGIVELFSDGTSTNDYVTFGWKPAAKG